MGAARRWGIPTGRRVTHCVNRGTMAAVEPWPTPDTPGPGQESVWDYPRPPRLEEFTGSITIELGGRTVASTDSRVAGAGDQPSADLLSARHLPSPTGCCAATDGDSWCEWKGQATYYDLVTETRVAPQAAWTYLQPSRDFAPIAGAIAVMAAAVDRCTVNGEQVIPQPGGFYGGWINQLDCRVLSREFRDPLVGEALRAHRSASHRCDVRRSSTPPDRARGPPRNADADRARSPTGSTR